MFQCIIHHKWHNLITMPAPTNGMSVKVNNQTVSPMAFINSKIVYRVLYSFMMNIYCLLQNIHIILNIILLISSYCSAFTVAY